MFLNPGGCLPLPWGYICTYMYMTIIFKDLQTKTETTLPIKAEFHVEPPGEGGKKVYINGPGHITKMAAMPIYGKNSSPEPKVI